MTVPTPPAVCWKRADTSSHLVEVLLVDDRPVGHVDRPKYRWGPPVRNYWNCYVGAGESAVLVGRRHLRADAFRLVLQHVFPHPPSTTKPSPTHD